MGNWDHARFSMRTIETMCDWDHVQEPEGAMCNWDCVHLSICTIETMCKNLEGT